MVLPVPPLPETTCKDTSGQRVETSAPLYCRTSESSLSPATLAGMTTWEYATVPLLIHATKQILDTWGQDGWELVQVVPGPMLRTLSRISRDRSKGELMSLSARLSELGIELPEVAAPLASYIPAKRSGNYVYTSGPVAPRGRWLIASGKVRAEVDEATAQECPGVHWNALAAVAAVIGGLDNIRSIVKVVGFVASDPSFSGQPTVINGASDLLGEIFGDAEAMPRSAVGVSVLPKDTGPRSK